MSYKMENIIKDYLFVAILLGFLVYKIPNRTAPVSEIPPTINISEYMEKESLIKSSIFQTGVRLLDIKLELESNSLAKSSDLFAFIKFDSFGDVPTLINLDYVITDADGQVVYEEVGDVTVETEKSITKDFKNLNLKKGEYTLYLRTLYNIEVRDEFKQTFVVKGPSAGEIISWLIVALGLVFVTTNIILRLIKPQEKK